MSSVGTAAADGSGRRLLLVHAHPDDESITTGATMAWYAAAGVQVTLVTCTRGELGEVIGDEHAHRVAERENTLGEHREQELRAAMRALGVHDQRFLGGEVRRYHDSGMAYDGNGRVVMVPQPPPGAFALADLDVAAGDLAEVVREVRPQVVVTYEPGGGYGHPDHVQAHRVSMRAIQLACQDSASAPGWVVAKVYWIVTPHSVFQDGLRAMAAAGLASGVDPAGPWPSQVVPDEQVSTVLRASAGRAAKVAALRAHRTQVTLSDDEHYLALSNEEFQPAGGVEYFRLVVGQPAGPWDQDGREEDLFAGVGG